jgi:hypothetical protein
MSASTAARESKMKKGDLEYYLMGAVKINKGTFVFVRQADGNAYPARATGGITDYFVGVAYETVDNSAGSAGATGLRVIRNGSHVFTLTSATQTDVGAPVYALDDQTVTITSSTSVVQVGYIAQVIDSSDVRIRIGGALH